MCYYGNISYLFTRVIMWIRHIYSHVITYLHVVLLGNISYLVTFRFTIYLKKINGNNYIIPIHMLYHMNDIILIHIYHNCNYIAAIHTIPLPQSISLAHISGGQIFWATCSVWFEVFLWHQNKVWWLNTSNFRQTCEKHDNIASVLLRYRQIPASIRQSIHNNVQRCQQNK